MFCPFVILITRALSSKAHTLIHSWKAFAQISFRVYLQGSIILTPTARSVRRFETFVYSLTESECVCTCSHSQLAWHRTTWELLFRIQLSRSESPAEIVGFHCFVCERVLWHWQNPVLKEVQDQLTVNSLGARNSCSMRIWQKEEAFHFLVRSFERWFTQYIAGIIVVIM